MSISPEGKNLSNLSPSEKLSLKQLKSDRNIVIKEADKGSAVVVWDRGDYISEANRQLHDRQVYEEVEVDPSVVLGKTINSTILDKSYETTEHFDVFTGSEYPLPPPYQCCFRSERVDCDQHVFMNRR